MISIRSLDSWFGKFTSRIRLPNGGRRVIIVGAGVMGAELADELVRRPELGLLPVGFVDDVSKRGLRIKGVPVLGLINDIPAIAQAYRIDEAILALPRASRREIWEIVTLCRKANVTVKIVPGISQVLSEAVSVTPTRHIRVEDVMQRMPIQTDISTISNLVQGKNVVVTGGGGSIGSELCRQLLAFQPSRLIVLGHGENSVFNIYTELNEKLADLRMTTSTMHTAPAETLVVPVIADVRDSNLIKAALSVHKPDIVFHAAAHKHLSLIEANPLEAISNNVLGTYNLVRTCCALEIPRFVMISTDKAVNPTSILGASKRLAELLVYKAAHDSGKAYTTVRFGNVLGSRGGFIQIFQRQIERGGPMQVTHPDMVRYFMSIPEAVQLVLQAATLGTGGEIFVLDMGQPVKILDLVRQMITVAGFEPGKDIDIVFTGIRPGEKLFEELFLDGENCHLTEREKIHVALNTASYLPANLHAAMQELKVAIIECNMRSALDLIQMLVPEFRPHMAAADKVSANVLTKSETP